MSADGGCNKTTYPRFLFSLYYAMRMKFLVGVDEAGRGALAGPVATTDALLS